MEIQASEIIAYLLVVLIVWYRRLEPLGQSCYCALFAFWPDLCCADLVRFGGRERGIGRDEVIERRTGIQLIVESGYRP